MPKQVISLATIDNKIASAEERLNRLVEQKKKFIAQEKTFITIGQLVCETLNCSFENISLDALREYLDTHREDMRIISLVYRDDNNAHEDNSEVNYLQ
ncbi:hypothetical protein [Streptococcus uberis]